MLLKEAAYIIGSMGGRPSTRRHTVTTEIRRGGFVVVTTYLLQEDGVSRITLEDGSGFLLLEI